MARPRNHRTGNAAVKADRLLRRDFAQLHEAMSDWLDGGDFSAIEVALDGVMHSTQYYPHEPIHDGMERDERIVLLGQRLASAAMIATRLARELRAAEKACTSIRDQLLSTIAEPADVPDYVLKLWRRLQAAGATQGDLQPQSKSLAEALLDAARAHNKSRKSGALQSKDEGEIEPIVRWADLPQEFAGFRLRDIHPDEAKKFGPCPLPPSTDIADFTADGQRPPIKGNRRATVGAWTEIVRAWSARENRGLAPMEAAVWALLLAHHLPNDESNLPNLVGVELQSPWERHAIVVLEALPMSKAPVASQHDDEDDVPY